MSQAMVILMALLLVGLVLATAAAGLGYRLTPERKRREAKRQFLTWCIKGLGLPALAWMLMNLGLSWNLPPFMPVIQAAQAAGGAWGPEFVQVVGVGLFIIFSYWTAVTLLWALARARAGIEEEDARSDFKTLCLTCTLAMFVPALIIWAVGGWSLFGVAVCTILLPLAGYAPGILNMKAVPPMYARAIARIKFGKYSEAEWEIIRELEKSEDDFQGWLMLAELHANHFKDLGEAEKTVIGICDQPKVTPSQLSIALHKLADWYLKLADDPDAARRALQAVITRLPNTHLAHMAQLRINQLPATRAELRQQRVGKPVRIAPMAELPPPPPPAPELDREQAARAANGCVALLQQDPNNVAAREKLARILAEQLGKVDLGIDQLNLLLGMAEQPDETRAEWLSLIVAWQLQYREDLEAGREGLKRLIQEYPQSPRAFEAQRRLFLMEAGARR
jgi:hypothetical protein